MKTLSKFLVCFLMAVTLFSCNKDDNADDTGAKLIFKFVFDKNQERLDNFGNPSTIPAGHRAQSPDFNMMAAHYIELTPNAFTPLGQGAVIYNSPKTSSNAFIFDELAQAGNNEVFLKFR